MACCLTALAWVRSSWYSGSWSGATTSLRLSFRRPVALKMASWRLALASVSWAFRWNSEGMGSARSQDLRQVHGADVRAGSGERALNLHQATGVEGNHRAGPGAEDGFHLGARHGAGKFGELDGEGAAEAAAFLGRGEFAQFQIAHAGQQAAGSVLHAQFTKGVAAVVEGDDVIEARAHILDAGHLSEKRGELEDALFQGADARQCFGLLMEELGEVVRDHGRAGAGRDHDQRRGFECIE